MKKTTLFVAFFALTFSVFAQRSAGPMKNVALTSPHKSNPAPMMVVDTLMGIFGDNFSGPASPMLIGGPGFGWCSGVNSYGDWAKAQGFAVTTPYTVQGAIIWFAGKNAGSGNPGSKMVAKIHDLAGSATISTGTGSGPGLAVAGTDVDILLSAIDTTAAGNYGLVTVNFPTAYNAVQDWAVVVDIQSVSAGDTIGIVMSDTLTPTTTKDMAFDQFSDGSWNSYLAGANWGWDVDLAIFPIVNINSAVNELFFINGIKLYQNYPNPSNGVSTISFELEQAAKNVKLIVQDVNGKFVKEVNLGNQSLGKHDVSFDASELAQGTYHIMIQADRNRLAQKMSIVK